MLLRLLAASLFLLPLSCGGAGRGQDSGRPIGVEIGYEAPALELPRLDREDRLALRDLRGKVVLLSFWASWCGPCRVETPALEDAWQRYKTREVVFVGVSVDDARADALAFQRAFPVTFPSAIDLAGERVTEPWEVWSLPTTVLLDRDGVVRRRHVGFTPRQLRDMLAELDELLQE